MVENAACVEAIVVENAACVEAIVVENVACVEVIIVVDAVEEVEVQVQKSMMNHKSKNVVVAAEADPGIKTNHRTTATSVLLA